MFIQGNIVEGFVGWFNWSGQKNVHFYKCTAHQHNRKAKKSVQNLEATLPRFIKSLM